MAIRTKAVLKGYFNTGDIPTEANFADLIETMNSQEAKTGLLPIKNSDGDIVSYEVNVAAVTVNVSLLTNATYSTPEAAANALFAIMTGVKSASNGMKIAYCDAQNRTWEYLYNGSSWILNGDRSVVDVTDKFTLNEYISTSGVAYPSATVSGSGSKEDPFVYKYMATPFIKIEKLEGIMFIGSLSDNYGAVSLYDKDYNFLKCMVSGSGNKSTYISSESINAAGDVKYVRFCTLRSYDSNKVTIESDQATERNSILLQDLRGRVNNLELTQEGGCAGFWVNGLNPDMESFIGSKKILDDWDFYLVHEDGDNTSIVGKLQKNNIFRFKDGRYAPVVVIAGDAVAEHPWETTDQNYAILRAWNGNKFVLNGTGTDHRNVYGIYNEKVTIDGVTAKEMEMTGICADLPTLYGGKLRCIPFKGIDTSCGHKGNGNIIDMFKVGAYPKTNVNQFTTNDYATSKNTAGKGDLKVFAPQMAFHKLSHIYAHYLKHGTFYLHKQSMYGGGISSNIGVNASNWGDVAGVRWTVGGSTQYGTFQTSPNNVRYNASGGNSNWSDLLNSEYAKLQTLEAQCAISMAVENEIQPGIDFEYAGGTYYYKTIEGCKSPLEGEMNCRLYKKMEGTYSMFDTEGNPISVKVEVILEVGVVDGYISWGDVFDYGNAGVEIISEDTGTELDGAPSARKLYSYLCTHQQNLYMGTETQWLSTEKKPIETDYEKFESDIVNWNEGWMAEVLPFSSLGKTRGGGIGTGTCNYSWIGNYYGGKAGYTSRLTNRGRCRASLSTASSRFLFATTLASVSTPASASAYQAKLPVPEN